MTYTDKHFRSVYLLKLACILLLLTTITIIFFLSLQGFITEKTNKLGITDFKFAAVSFLDDTSIKMKQLSLSGKMSNDTSYQLNASEANKDMQGTVQMKDIELAYDRSKTNENLFITSDFGIMQEEEKFIQIDNIAIIRFNDYIVHTTGLYIDLNNNSAKSNNSIIMKKGSSTLQADKFSTDDNSQIINLSGNVKASVNLSDVKN